MLPAAWPLRGPRVTLRAFRADDLDELAGLMADPVVRRFFPSVLTREESAAMLARHMGHMAAFGFGFGALEVPGLGFGGMLGCGLVVKLPFSPAVEVGWLLRPEAWGQGYATEGARLALADAFARTTVPDIVAFTTTINAPSQAVMHRLGMTRDPADDFDHPSVPDGHEQQRHVLFRARRPLIPAADDSLSLHGGRGPG